MVSAQPRWSLRRSFKGRLKVRDEIVFGQGGGADCIWTFDEESIGRQYLYYLTRPEKFSESDRRFLPLKDHGIWFAFGCGRSTGLARATDDLLYLENISKRRGRTRISGTIGGGFYYPDLDVEGKKIKIIGAKKPTKQRQTKMEYSRSIICRPGSILLNPKCPPGGRLILPGSGIQRALWERNLGSLK